MYIFLLNLSNFHPQSLSCLLVLWKLFHFIAVIHLCIILYIVLYTKPSKPSGYGACHLYATESVFFDTILISSVLRSSIFPSRIPLIPPLFSSFCIKFRCGTRLEAFLKSKYSLPQPSLSSAYKICACVFKMFSPRCSIHRHYELHTTHVNDTSL